MTDATFTPGPWEYEVHELSSGPSGIVYGARGYAIADHLSEADARLVAAAPRMFALIKRVAEHFAATDAPMGIEASAILEAVKESAND